MNFEIEMTELPEVKIINGKRFHDNRGFFSEIYKVNDFTEMGLPTFVQDNISVSTKGVIRGLHWQENPFGQGKLIQCLSGAILDVAVDVRVDSPNYGKHVAVELKGSEPKLLWVPVGFAHGFESLEDGTIVKYKVTSYWNALSERSLHYSDPDIGIEWKLNNHLVSEKDQMAPFLNSHKLN